jgi:hypothetical protein
VEIVAMFEVSGLQETRNGGRILKKTASLKASTCNTKHKVEKIYFRRVTTMRSVWSPIHCQAVLRLAVRLLEDKHKSSAESSFKSESTYLKNKQDFHTRIYTV